MSDTANDKAPDLTPLTDTYDFLTELHTSGTAVTYLGRHRELGRDVAITVVQVPGGGSNNTLTHFASDARLLSTMRHPNVAPVIEGRWLGNEAFAVVRARVRGTTLDQVLAAVGPMPLPRVGDTLAQVNSALTWARSNGVVHRQIAPENIWFQQGSGTVLLELGWSQLPAGSLPDECTDAVTIGALASAMFTGNAKDWPAAGALAAARPDLPAEVVAETEALLACTAGGAPRDVGAFLAMLGSEPAAVSPTPVVMAAAPVMEKEMPVEKIDERARTTPTPPRTEETVVIAPTGGPGRSRAAALTIVGAGDGEGDARGEDRRTGEDNA